MEGNCLSESPPPSADICCSNELNRSNSDASALTLENCEDILLRSADVNPDDSRMWTDEKHSLYLENLEVSFVKQLYQSIGLLSRCSDQDKRHKDATQMRPNNVDTNSEQFTTVPHGCPEKINYNRVDPLSHVSPDSLSPIKSPWVHRSKRIGMHCPAKSAHVPELLMNNADSQGKVSTSHGSNTCSQQCSANSRYHGDSIYLMREGAGQNFVDEDNQAKQNSESPAKRLKTALPDQSMTERFD